MEQKLIVESEILIDAPAAHVWETLVNPKYVAQWDELPENYPEEKMGVGSKVVWNLPNGEQSITKVIKAEEEKELVIALHGTGWEVKPAEGEVAYHYKLADSSNQTLLNIRIGDFGLLKDGQMYYDASVEFAEESKRVIKKIAESL